MIAIGYVHHHKSEYEENGPPPLLPAKEDIKIEVPLDDRKKVLKSISDDILKLGKTNEQ